nr:unnamed protein product [Digitaria exilis]
MAGRRYTKLPLEFAWRTARIENVTVWEGKKSWLSGCLPAVAMAVATALASYAVRWRLHGGNSVHIYFITLSVLILSAASTFLGSSLSPANSAVDRASSTNSLHPQLRINFLHILLQLSSQHPCFPHLHPPSSTLAVGSCGQLSLEFPLGPVVLSVVSFDPSSSSLLAPPPAPPREGFRVVSEGEEGGRWAPSPWPRVLAAGEEPQSGRRRRLCRALCLKQREGARG